MSLTDYTFDWLQVESYLRIMGEPKLPSAFLQVGFQTSPLPTYSNKMLPCSNVMMFSVDLFWCLTQPCELQVICWVLGEYGTADGKYSASYITGKICDIAEAHSTDDMVKVCEIQLLFSISCNLLV